MKYRHENVSQCDLNKFVRNLLKVYDKSFIFILGILFVKYFIKKTKKKLMNREIFENTDYNHEST